MEFNSRLCHAVIAGASLCVSFNASAEISGTGSSANAFLYGDNIEVGIGSDGAFGSDVKSRSGISNNSYLGFINYPTGGVNAYNGDFILQSGPLDEEGWGVGFDGKAFNNNNSSSPEISGQLESGSFKTTDKYQSVSWKGDIQGLEIKQVYHIYMSGTALVIDVSLTNTTSSEMKQVYYMRTINPQNNAEHNNGDSSRYDTINTIISQGSDGNGVSAVSAKQNAKPGIFAESTLTLNGYGENSRVTYGGKQNRNPVDVYTGAGLLKQVGSNTADDSISIAFKFEHILPGDTVTLRTGYQLDDVPVPAIDIDADDSSDPTGNGYKQLYILGSVATKLTDSDVTIEGDDFTQLQEAIITLTNPHQGDKLEVADPVNLPAAISVDEEESSDTKIYLRGSAATSSYKTALKQIQFKNSDTHASIETRKITLQVIDEHAIPSNTATSTVMVTTPVELDDANIADDDVLSASEVNAVAFSGHAAANASLVIDFTDSNGNKLNPPKTLNADDDGNWNIDSDATDLSSLDEGLITVLITATDTNGNISTLSKEITKDSVVLLANITPADNETVSNPAPLYQGKTDANASVTLKVLPAGKVYSGNADENGDWSIQLDKFPMGVSTSVLITAEDEYQNQASKTLTFKTPDLPIEVTDLDADATGLAHSTTPTIKGKSKPNVTITISMPTSNGKSIECTTTTDADGNWSCTLPISPAGGPYTLSVTATDAAGNSNSSTHELTIPNISLDIDSPEENQLVSSTTPVFNGTTEPGATVKLSVQPDGKSYTTTADAQGNWSIALGDPLAKGKTISVEVTASDSAGNKTSTIRKIKTPSLPIDITDLDADENFVAHSTTPTIKGTSEPNTNISINMPTTGGQVIQCNTTTDTNGNWICTLPLSHSGGPYTLTVTTTDSEGNSNSSSHQLTIPEIPLIIDKPVNDAVISGIKPLVSGTSTPGTNVKVIASNGSSCSAVTDEGNHWSCQLTSLAFDQSYTLTVTTMDSIGNSTAKVVNISTDKLPLSVIAPQDNSTTEDTTPTFIGTTTAGTTVTVSMPTGQECSTVADSEDHWSCELPALPVGGPYTATIKAVDSNQNQTTLTENITIPAIPLIISSPVENEVIVSDSVTVTGSSDPDTAITVLGPDGESCNTTSDASGAWSCALENLQSGKGKHITVISGEDTNSRKVAITTIDIENSSEKVKTILGGSSSPVSLIMLFLILLMNACKRVISRNIHN